MHSAGAVHADVPLLREHGTAVSMSAASLSRPWRRNADARDAPCALGDRAAPADAVLISGGSLRLEVGVQHLDSFHEQEDREGNSEQRLKGEPNRFLGSTKPECFLCGHCCLEPTFL